MDPAELQVFEDRWREDHLRQCQACIVISAHLVEPRPVSPNSKDQPLDHADRSLPDTGEIGYGWDLKIWTNRHEYELLVRYASCNESFYLFAT